MAIEVVAQTRKGQGRGASRRLRHSGKVPGIVYGGKKPAVTIELAGLGAVEVRALVGSVTGARPDDEVVDAAIELTGGNPFFVGEILRHLAESGTLVQKAAGWVTTIAPARTHTGIACSGAGATTSRPPCTKSSRSNK